MLGPRAGALTFAAAVLLLLSGCAPSSSSPPGALATTTGGFVVITAGGTALVDGQDDVPPTLDLRVVVPSGVTAQQVQARLDGSPLDLSGGAQGAVTAKVAPMPLGSAHTLDLAVPDRDPQHISFHVAPPAGAAAAFHADPADGAVLDVAFQFAPRSRSVVEAAVPTGATISWLDGTHLRATWPAAPGGSLQLPAGLAT